MPTADADGVSLYYEERGSGDPVVFVHGIPTDYRAWGAQVEPFSRSYRMIALSRRYAAPNMRQGDILDSTVQNNAADIAGFVQKLGIVPVHLVAHSYGGYAATYLAADHPDLLRSLVLVEPAVATMLVADPKSQAQVLSLLFRSPSVALAARRFQSGSLFPALRALEEGNMERAVELNVDGIQAMRGAYRGFPEEIRRMMLDNARTVGEQRTDFPRFTAAEAGKIKTPTLIINGESSALWLRRIGEMLVRSIPGARRETVGGARHFPHMENPGSFNKAVLGFVGGRK